MNSTKPPIRVTYEFVDSTPDTLRERTVYVSIRFNLVVHRCCCGCGFHVITPLAPDEWRLTFDGATVSLYPSIGNQLFACRSHYWITRSQVRWVDDDEAITPHGPAARRTGWALLHRAQVWLFRRHRAKNE